MPEYTHVEKPFLDQLRSMNRTITDEGRGIPSVPTKNLRTIFREWIHLKVFRNFIRGISALDNSMVRVSYRRLDELKDQLLRQPSCSLLDGNGKGCDILTTIW